MSGTDHSFITEFQPQPRIILVRPQMGENIGASARAMWNFGLDRMCLVDPRDGWPNPAATALASGAAQVLDNVILCSDLKSATADLHYVMATTARDRDLTKEVVSPKEAMMRARQLIASGKKVGILFGPERAGLENEDIALADALVSVPVNPAFGSLNLAQCVLLLAYEWELTKGAQLSHKIEWGDANPAMKGDRAVMQNMLEERLDEIGFFWPEKKADNMKLTLRNMFGRMPLSDLDIRMLQGVFRALWRGEPFANKKNSGELFANKKRK